MLCRRAAIAAVRNCDPAPQRALLTQQLTLATVHMATHQVASVHTAQPVVHGTTSSPWRSTCHSSHRRCSRRCSICGHSPQVVTSRDVTHMVIYRASNQSHPAQQMQQHLRPRTANGEWRGRHPHGDLLRLVSAARDGVKPAVTPPFSAALAAAAAAAAEAAVDVSEGACLGQTGCTNAAAGGRSGEADSFAGASHSWLVLAEYTANSASSVVFVSSGR